jgi:hypothetical protein
MWNTIQITVFYFSFFLFLLLPLELRASLKRFVSLQFLDYFTDDSAPWTGDHLVARPLPKHRTTRTQNKHIRTSNIHALCGIRTHDPSFRASEDSSCLRPLGYRDRPMFYNSAKLWRKLEIWLCPSFGQNCTRQNKDNLKENVPFSDGANTVWSVLLSFMVFVKCERSELHAGTKYTDFSLRRWDTR